MEQRGWLGLQAGASLTTCGQGSGGGVQIRKGGGEFGKEMAVIFIMTMILFLAPHPTPPYPTLPYPHSDLCKANQHWKGLPHSLAPPLPHLLLALKLLAGSSSATMGGQHEVI